MSKEVNQADGKEWDEISEDLFLYIATNALFAERISKSLEMTDSDMKLRFAPPPTQSGLLREI